MLILLLKSFLTLWFLQSEAVLVLTTPTAQLCRHNTTVTAAAIYGNVSISFAGDDGYAGLMWNAEGTYTELDCPNSTYGRVDPKYMNSAWNVEISPDGTMFAFSSEYGHDIWIGSVATGEMFGFAHPLIGMATSWVAWSPDSRYISWNTGRKVGIFKVANLTEYYASIGNVPVTWQGSIDKSMFGEGCPGCSYHEPVDKGGLDYRETSEGSAWSSDGNFLVEGGGPAVRIRSMPEGKVMHTFENQQGSVTGVDWKGSTIVTVSAEAILIRAPGDGYAARPLFVGCPQELVTCSRGAILEFTSASLSPDGLHLATSSKGYLGEVAVWEVASGKVVCTMQQWEASIVKWDQSQLQLLTGGGPTPNPMVDQDCLSPLQVWDISQCFPTPSPSPPPSPSPMRSLTSPSPSPRARSIITSAALSLAQTEQYLGTDWGFAFGTLPSSPPKLSQTELVVVNGTTHSVGFYSSGDVAVPASEVITAAGTHTYEVKSWGASVNSGIVMTTDFSSMQTDVGRY